MQYFFVFIITATFLLESFTIVVLNRLLLRLLNLFTDDTNDYFIIMFYAKCLLKKTKKDVISKSKSLNKKKKKFRNLNVTCYV